MIDSDTPKHSLKQWVSEHLVSSNIIVALLYVLFAQIGFLAANIEHQASPLWPPMGLVLAAVFISGRALFPGIGIATLLVQLGADCPLLVSSTITLGVLSAATVANILLDWLRRHQAEISSKNIIKAIWIVVASLLTATISSSVGTTSLYLLDSNPPPVAPQTVWYTWFMGDCIGGLVVAQALLALRRIKPSAGWMLRLLLIIVLAAFSYSLIFYYGNGTPFLFLAFPVLLFACHWFGPSGSAFATLGFVIYASFVAINPYALSEGAHNEHILLIDFFILALAVTSLTISALYKRDYFFFPAVLFLIGWLLCGWLYYSLKTNATKLDETQFLDLVSDAEKAVTDRLRIYTDALQAGAAYRTTTEEMTREQWRDYVNYVNIPVRYRGINGLGFIMPFTADELPAFVETVPPNEYGEFTIKSVPGVQRPPSDEMGYDHYIITHIEPLANNYKALGLDTASETNRQSAGRRARDTGQPAMTQRIILVQDGQSRPGFLVYVPMYKSNEPLTNVQERRDAFIGWSYAPFVTENFLDGVLGERADQINFEIFDNNTISPKSFVYGTMNTQSSTDHLEFDATSRLDLAGVTFSFGWRRGADFQTQDASSATIAAASLAVGTCLFVGIFVNLQSTTRRANAIVQVKTAELLKANDTLTKEIHDRKEAESQAEEAKQIAEAANLAKSEFLATMSHEIRTPMNSVLGFSELLTESELSCEQRLWTNYIQSSGRSLLHIINDILDFSKIEANKLDLEQIPFSLETAIEEITSSFSLLAGQKGIIVNFEQKHTSPRAVIGDPIRLKQILTNLIANALKFTQKGSITISLEWNDRKENSSATIRVADTGIGIPADKVDKLFEKFTQVDSSTTRKFGGTGLGLAICKNLTSLMGGHIHAESVEGKGTTMVLEIPFELSSEPASNQTRPPFPTSDKNDSHAEIDVLLVDDNKINRHLGAIMLKRFACNVTVAEDGQEAIDRLTTTRFPIVFLDCQMPIMDGYETATEIRRLEAAGECDTLSPDKPVKIIAFTADASKQAREDCLAAGMDDFICKPIRKEDFKTMLETYQPSDESSHTTTQV